jgi:hypothetical protein
MTVKAVIEEQTTVWTLQQVAAEMGLHRSTIVRMEQRNLLPKAKWAGPPVNGRVYDAKDKKAMKAILDAHFASKTGHSDRVLVKAPVLAASEA